MWYALLSHSWSGLLVAALVGGLAAAIVYAAKALKRPKVRFFGYAFYGLAALFTVGACVAIVRIEVLERRYPPMGKLLDVGGYRMHLLAEGDARGGPTVLWIGGAHSQGLAFYPHHKEIRGEARSILFDRPGTGWSDTGPFPRRTSREVEELQTLLQRAGEKGPFLVVGHSYGGLLAANFARRHRDEVAGLVLLDATAPDSIVYPPGGGDAMGMYKHLNQLLGFSKLLGLQVDPYEIFAKRNRDVARLLETLDAQFGDINERMQANEAGPASSWAAASLMGELGGRHHRETAAELVVYDGELHELPVYVAVPRGDFDKAIAAADVDATTKRRAANFYEKVRLRYLATSARSKLFYAPTGTSHNFPYERPEFVLGLVRQALAEARGAPSAGEPLPVDLVTRNTERIRAPARAIWPLLFHPADWKASVARSERLAGTAGAVGELTAIYDANEGDAAAYHLLTVEVVPNERLVWRIFRPGDSSVIGYAAFGLNEHDGLTDLTYDVYASYQVPSQPGLSVASVQDRLRASTSAKLDADGAALKALAERQWRVKPPEARAN